MGKETYTLQDKITTEAAKAYNLLGGEFNVDIVLWETILAAGKRAKIVKGFLSNPGLFISTMVNVKGVDEYDKLRDDVTQKAEELRGLTPEV